MQKSKYKIRRILHLKAALFLAFFFLLFSSHVANAAALYFDPQERTVGIGQPFKVGLLIDAVDPINAFDVVVDIPLGMAVTDSSDGNSIISYWIERPTYDPSNNTLEFSGIVPGGFSGSGGRLLVLTLVAKDPGINVITYDQKTDIILNGPSPISDQKNILPLNLTVEQGKELADNVIPDIDPPESFAPIIATSTSIYGGKWAIYFQTEDKGSGIYGYEVAESPYKTDSYDSLHWQDADSPYLLQDQSLTDYIYVKATDKSGNDSIEIVPPRSVEWSLPFFWVIIIIVVFICLLILVWSH
jgi:hypothetical protein